MNTGALPPEITRLAQRLGHVFTDENLLLQACSHRSYGPPHNERLEYLGDGLLNFVIGSTLYALRPSANEGDLSRLRASLVREETLAQLARDLNLGDALRLGPGELRSGGFRRDSILADALEALLGAIHQDAGFDAARDACLRLYQPLLAALPDARSLKDAKTRLQEHLQGSGRPLPQYAVLDESGPPHHRRFKVSCTLEDAEHRTEAVGSSRKLAEQDAAGMMLELLEPPMGRDDA